MWWLTLICCGAESLVVLSFLSVMLQSLRFAVATSRYTHPKLHFIPLHIRSRSFTSTRLHRYSLQTQQQQPTAAAAHPTVVLYSPSPESIEEEEIDVDVIPPNEIRIELTDRAAEVRPSNSILSLIYSKLTGIWWVATSNDSLSGIKSRCGSSDSGGEWWMSWVSI